ARGFLDRLRDLVPLQHVLEGSDPEAEVLRDAAEHEDLVLPVAVAVDEPVASEDLGEGFELQVAARGRAALVGGVPARPRGGVLLRLLEAVAEDRLDAHARLRVAAAALAVGLLDVLAERELDAGLRV